MIMNVPGFQTGNRGVFAALFYKSRVSGCLFLPEAFLSCFGKKGSKEADSGGSDPNAASGRRSEGSEWQRSTDAKVLCHRRQMSGTATGKH